MASQQTPPRQAGIFQRWAQSWAQKTQSEQARSFLIWATIVLVVAVVLTAFLPIALIGGFKDATEVITIVTLTSVGIERVIEGFWTYIGLTKNSWWPFNSISQNISNMASDLDKELTPFYQQLTQAVEDAKIAENWTDEQYTAAKKEITDFQASIDQLTKLAPGNQLALSIASAASQLASGFKQKYTTLDTVATFADQAINGFAYFIVTPADTLGRRLISLYLGMILGVVIAAVFGLDLLRAIFQIPTIAFHYGVVFTGLAIGLGSSPTHEVIQLLQQWKTNLKTQSA